MDLQLRPRRILQDFTARLADFSLPPTVAATTSKAPKSSPRRAAAPRHRALPELSRRIGSER